MTVRARQLSRVILNRDSVNALSSLINETGTSAQTVFDTLLPLVALDPTRLDLGTYNLELDQSGGGMEKSLNLTTVHAEGLFNTVVHRYGIGQWATVNLVLQRGVELYYCPPTPENISAMGEMA